MTGQERRRRRARIARVARTLNLGSVERRLGDDVWLDANAELAQLGDLADDIADVRER